MIPTTDWVINAPNASGNEAAAGCEEGCGRSKSHTDEPG